MPTFGELNPFRYRSYYYDSDIEMYYLQSRYYDPEICRFINCDDVNYIGVSQSEISYNPFAYCENNPVNFKDPTGTILDTILDGVETGRDVEQDLKNAKSDLKRHAQNVVNIGYCVANKKSKYKYKYKKSFKMKLTYYSHCKSTYNVLTTYAEYLFNINLKNYTWSKLSKYQKNELLNLIGSWDFKITYNVARYYAGNRGAKIFMDSFVF